MNRRYQHNMKNLIFMSDLRRVDAQGIGTSHPEGVEAGRRERLDVMRTSNPAFVLRASTLAQAIKAAEEGGERCNECHDQFHRAYPPYASELCAIFHVCMRRPMHAAISPRPNICLRVNLYSPCSSSKETAIYNETCVRACSAIR